MGINAKLSFRSHAAACESKRGGQIVGARGWWVGGEGVGCVCVCGGGGRSPYGNCPAVSHFTQHVSRHRECIQSERVWRQGGGVEEGGRDWGGGAVVRFSSQPSFRQHVCYVACLR